MTPMVGIPLEQVVNDHPVLYNFVFPADQDSVLYKGIMHIFGG
jgi:hypothetical protein